MRCSATTSGPVLREDHRERTQGPTDGAASRVAGKVVTLLELELRPSEDQPTRSHDGTWPSEPDLPWLGRVVPLAITRSAAAHPAIHHKDRACGRLAARPRPTTRPLQSDQRCQRASVPITSRRRLGRGAPSADGKRRGLGPEMQPGRVDQPLVLILELACLDEQRHVFPGARLDSRDIALDLAPRGHDLVGLLLIQQCGALASVLRPPEQRSIRPRSRDLRVQKVVGSPC